MSTNSSDVTRLTEPHSFSSGSALPDSGESCAEAAAPLVPLNQWGRPVTRCPDTEACNYHGCEAHCRPAPKVTWTPEDEARLDALIAKRAAAASGMLRLVDGTFVGCVAPRKDSPPSGE
jgi:hypothetical protein